MGKDGQVFAHWVLLMGNKLPLSMFGSAQCCRIPVQRDLARALQAKIRIEMLRSRVLRIKNNMEETR